MRQMGRTGRQAYLALDCRRILGEWGRCTCMIKHMCRSSCMLYSVLFRHAYRDVYLAFSKFLCSGLFCVLLVKGTASVSYQFAIVVKMVIDSHRWFCLSRKVLGGVISIMPACMQSMKYAFFHAVLCNSHCMNNPS